MGVNGIETSAAAMTLEEGRDRGMALVQDHTERFVATVRALSPEEIDQRVPGLSWTVGETVTHVESVYLRYTSDLRRAATAADVAAQNGEDIERMGVDVARSAATIEEQVALMAAVVEHLDPHRQFPFHGGVSITAAGGWGNLLGELLAHGDDLARATGRPFGIPGPDLELIWRFTFPVLTGWIRPECRELDESWDAHLPFGTRRAVVQDGILRWDDGSAARSDHHELWVGDLEAFTLTFPYRRRAVNDAALALFSSRFRDL